MTKCIIKEKEIFEVKSFTSKPPECILSDFRRYGCSTYELTNGVKIKFKNQHHDYDNALCEFSFENAVFKTIEKNDFNLQTVLSYMNKYNGFVEREIENLVKQAEQKIKPQLQVEIEELSAKVETLKDKINIYTQIDE